MSDNKYIIDKDSLTGIADAVRDKLGEGSSISDPGAGYYSTNSTISKFSVESLSEYVSSYGRISKYVCRVADISSYIEPFTSIDITWSGGYCDFTINGGVYQDVQSPYTVTFNTPQNYLSIIWNFYNSSYSPYTVSVNDIVITLKNEKGNFLIPKQSQLTYQYNSTSNPSSTTSSFQSGNILVPIPMSLIDIENNITDYLQKTGGGTGEQETWKWSDSQSTYLTFPSGFSVENLKDITGLSNGYPRGLYKDSLGKPVSMIDQGISLPSSYLTIGSPLTAVKISTAHSEGRTFCIPWNWTGTKRIPDDIFFIWFVVEPNDSKIYLGCGRYANYVGNGKWTVIYTK